MRSESAQLNTSIFAMALENIVTPEKGTRRKRSSSSPEEEKTSAVEPNMESASLPKKRKLEEPNGLPDPTSIHVNFAAFSLRDDEEGFIHIGNIKHKSDQNLLTQYLLEHYTAYDVLYAGPYMVMTCREVPPFDKRPFTIAGCVAVWLDEEEEYPPDILIGDMRDDFDAEVEFTDDIVQDLQPYRLPRAETLQAIGNYFPRAEYITFLNSSLLIELPETDLETYIGILKTMPHGVKDSEITFNYQNGPKASTAVFDHVVNVATEARALLRSSDISFGDEFAIDGDINSRQFLKCLGLRSRVLTKDRTKKESTLPEGVEPTPAQPRGYIPRLQMIYATTAPVLESAREIHGGIHGLALIRSRKADGGDVLSKGSVGGFMHFSKMRTRPKGAGKILCFVEALDEMVEDGRSKVCNA